MGVQGQDITPAEKAKFIQALKKTGGNVSKAAEAIKRSRSGMYILRNNDPDFAALWDEASETVFDKMEQELYRRAVMGVREPVIKNGQIATDAQGNPLYQRRYSDRLLEFALKGNRPEKFGDKSDINLTIRETELIIPTFDDDATNDGFNVPGESADSED